MQSAFQPELFPNAAQGSRGACAAQAGIAWHTSAAGIQLAAEGDLIAVKTGPSRWDAVTGEMLLDFDVAEVKGDVVAFNATPVRKSAAAQAREW